MITGSEFANVARANLVGRILGDATVNGTLVTAFNGQTPMEHTAFVGDMITDVRSHNRPDDIELLDAMGVAINGGVNVALDGI